MKITVLFRLSLMLFSLSGLSVAISVSFTSGGIGGQSSFGSHYDLDSSARLIESATLGSGSISSSSLVEGSGDNSISKTAANNGASVSSSITSTGALSAVASSQASGTSVSLDQNVYATGQSEIAVEGSSDTLQANQEAGVLNGVLASSQTATAQSSTSSAVQSSNIAGTLGYSNGQAKSSDNTVKVTGGLNGAGIIQGSIASTASDTARVSGSINANSQDSKAYSAVESTSAWGNVYSYLSSNGQLASSIDARADDHVIADQDLQAKGDVRVYASSSSEDSSYKSYSACGEAISGGMSASSGNPAVIETNLQGDVQSSSDGIIPTPGSWVWNGFGGYLSSNPYQLKDGQGKIHTFVKGSDNSLWDNLDGDWQGLCGYITSDPVAANDAQGKMHILVRGGDGALWDRIFGGSWTSLGGYITSNPSAALKPDDNHLKVAVKGGDNAVWLKDLTTGAWSSLGGYITSNPQVIFDNQGKMHALVRGGDGALWDNINGAWNYHGGYITSDARPLVPSNSDPYLFTLVRGGDGSLWKNTANTNTGAASWQNFGGYISPSSTNTPYKGNPEPIEGFGGKMNVFVRGGDGALWDNINGNWYSLGGQITSDPSAAKNPISNSLQIAVRGGDGALWTNNDLIYRLYGLDFSPYMDGQDPNLHTQISETQLRARMKIIAPYTEWIRTYGCTDGLENAGRIAREMGLKAAVGAWLGKDLNDNEKQITNLIIAAKAGYVDTAVIGSEALARGDISEAQLIGYINRVKNEVPGIQVSYGFAYDDLNHPNVVSAVDVVYANIYPFYAGAYGINIDQAINNMDSGYYQYAIPRAQGKQVIVSETGWPSGGSINGAAVPSPENAAKYFGDFAGWARSKNVPYFYFESFDEGWKNIENSWGPFWGIWDKNGNLKSGM